MITVAGLGKIRGGAPVLAVENAVLACPRALASAALGSAENGTSAKLGIERLMTALLGRSRAQPRARPRATGARRAR